MNNNNVYKGDVQPNHKEYSVWVDNKGIIKAFDGNAWKASGIPIVEELDPTATIGSVVSYKQNIKIDKVETVNKTYSIRDLNYQILDYYSPEGYINTKGDVIKKINFLTLNIENIPSKFKQNGYEIVFVICSDIDFLGVGVSCQSDSFGAFWIKPGASGPIMHNNEFNQEGIERIENFFNNSKVYYSGIILHPNNTLTIEECFDFFDYFITVDATKEIKTTEEISKVIPHIKQEYGWESLEVTDKDFNNDFNFDFD